VQAPCIASSLGKPAVSPAINFGAVPVELRELLKRESQSTDP
jgi:hypothetical protein